jgi:hypothetical protein
LAFAEEQPGFIKRSVVANDNGQWMDIVEWDNVAAAKAASAKFMLMNVTTRFWALSIKSH